MTPDLDNTETDVGIAFAQAQQLRPEFQVATAGIESQGLKAFYCRRTRPVPVSDVGPTRPFADVLRDRVSRRDFTPLSIADVGRLMARSGLERSSGIDRSGASISRRAAPSAGARHPFSLILLARKVAGLVPGCWVLDPIAATLRLTSHGSTDIEKAFQLVSVALRSDVPPPATVLLVADPQATLTRYPTGISLLWREAGALMMTIHLAATDIGVRSCLVGTTGVLFPGNASGTALIDLGAVAIG